MRHIDEDTITQAVIARHAHARDARLREVMTSLVQHLHAFAREVSLSEAEWAAALRFLGECARTDAPRRQELVLLSDTLGLSALVGALGRRRAPLPAGEREGAAAASASDGGALLFLRGRVRNAHGEPIAGARVSVRASGVGVQAVDRTSDADGSFLAGVPFARAQAIPGDGPVGRLLAALGRTPLRPAHLQVRIDAPGHAVLALPVFRRGDPDLDTDALFGVRAALVADWVPHPAGRTPDGQASGEPFATLEYTFVLDPYLDRQTGDKP